MSPDPAPPDAPDDRPPLGQRLYDNVFLLLTVSLLIMFGVFTGWGMWEILTMPTATLP